MTQPIWLALKRTLDHILALLIPATGAHRRNPAPRPQPQHASPRTVSGLGLLTRITAPPRLLAKPGLWQRPHPAPLNGTPVLDGRDLRPLVPAYFLAYEQQQRRTALALALDGIDIGPWVIHGHPIGAPAMGVAA